MLYHTKDIIILNYLLLKFCDNAFFTLLYIDFMLCLESITLLSLTLPFCLIPKLTVGKLKYGVSMRPELEFPINNDESSIKPQKSFALLFL